MAISTDIIAAERRAADFITGVLPRGVERRRVVAGGVLALPLFAGDEVEIVDPQGLQPAHIAAFTHTGAAVTAAIGAPESAVTVTPDRLAQCLAADTESSRRLTRKLREHDINIAAADVREVLSGGDDTVAGNSLSFICACDALFLICAPGDDMLINDDILTNAETNRAPPTEIIIFIRRHNYEATVTEQPLPDPLTDPRDEIRIAHSTATAYEITAGEYIQIIDVEGRQCSDFQCFDRAQLDGGVERCLDATTTRALMGAAYPQPGLASKFYDVDFAPLVEVVQDTCGRHDSFGLACHAKYYDDAGYPGHVNCSDNFNAALAAYNIAPRAGWMAMNLFFNTFFDDAHQFAFDEPWSRAGDFVLLRAVKDMVCVSSACPCDIDAANGWNPTDIHLRIYPADSRFTRAVAHRKTADGEPDMTKPNRVPFAHRKTHPQLHRIRRLLARRKLHQPRRHRRILGLSRRRYRHRFIAAPQSRSHRTGRRTPAANLRHPRHPPPRRRASRVYRDVPRSRRHDRRRHRIPFGTRQLTMGRRRRRLGVMVTPTSGGTRHGCMG